MLVEEPNFCKKAEQLYLFARIGFAPDTTSVLSTKMMLIIVVAALLSSTSNVAGYNMIHHTGKTVQTSDAMKSYRKSSVLYTSTISEGTMNSVKGSSGVELAKEYLNSVDAILFVRKLVLLDKKMSVESEKLNFWSGESFVVKDCSCTGIVENGLIFIANCDVKGKAAKRDVLVPFSSPVTGTNNVLLFFLSLLLSLSFFFLFFCLSVCLSICLPVCISLFLSFYFSCSHYFASSLDSPSVCSYLYQLFLIFCSVHFFLSSFFLNSFHAFLHFNYLCSQSPLLAYSFSHTHAFSHLTILSFRMQQITHFTDEYQLKRVLVSMAAVSGKMKNAADIAKLNFGEDCTVPADLLFNDVPHPAWVSNILFIIILFPFIFVSRCPVFFSFVSRYLQRNRSSDRILYSYINSTNIIFYLSGTILHVRICLKFRTKIRE